MNLYNTESRKVIAYRDVYYDDNKIVSNGNSYELTFINSQLRYSTFTDDMGDAFSMSSDVDGKANSYVWHIDKVFHEEFDDSDLVTGSLVIVGL